MNPEKLKFIKEHAKDIRPTATDESTVKDIEDVEKGRPVYENRIDALLERYETKILTYERRDVAVGTSKILLEASQPANYSVAAPLVEDLMQDPRCVGITLLTDNVAGQQFEQSGAQLHLVREEKRPVMADIPAGPYDVALIFDEPQNTPQPVLLYGAKSVYGAKKLYFFAGGLGGEETQRILGPNADSKMDTIDGIFVDDELSKQLLCEIAHVPKEKVIVTGSPLIESLEPEKAKELRSIGREKLKISDSASVVFYAGVVTADFKVSGGGDDLNLHTYIETLEGVRIAAHHDPSREYVLAVRSHPRARDIETLPIPSELPANVRIVSGEGISYDEVVYAADVMCQNPLSSEVVLASYRGRTLAVFAYEGEHQFGQLCERIYGKEGIRIIRDSGRAVFAESSQGLASILEQHTESPQPIPKPLGSAREKIKEILLTNR